MSLPEVLAAVEKGSVIALLIINLFVIVVGGRRRWWVFGWYADEVIRQRDEWREVALSGTIQLERQQTITEKVVTGQAVRRLRRRPQ